jgi:hypothetical protein
MTVRTREAQMVSSRCGCANDSCACVITSGAGIAVDGGGSKTNPYIVTATPTGVQLSITDEGSLIRSGVIQINFVGAGVTVTTGTEGEVIVTIP